jgi:PilZ domain
MPRISFKEPDEVLQAASAESVRRHSSVLPGQALCETPLDHGPSGRMERRLPIIVVVRLAPAQGVVADGEEKTFTDNISPHGARIFSKHAWQLGDLVRVAPSNADVACAKVIYCQKLPDDRYGIGVKFQDHPVAWSATQRFNGL